MSHVLIVAIGPVQEFIAAGRKCRDIWYGSWLLSELSLAAAKSIEEAEGPNALVFPAGLASVTPGAESNVANKILAWVTSPRETAAKAEAAVQKRLREICDETFKRVGKGDDRREEFFKEAVARKQVESLIECTWAFSAASNSYEDARATAERLLAARKNTKLWSQPPWAGPVPKSSLDGIRESVLDESLFDEPNVGKADAPDPAALRRRYGVHGAERLCGVGLLKRFGRTDRFSEPNPEDDGETAPDEIFSTTHVAALPYLDALAKHEAGKPAFATLVRQLEKVDRRIIQRMRMVPGGKHPVSGNIDGALLFPARLEECIEEFAGKLRKESKAEELAKDAAAHLAAFLTRWGEPLPYYAVLLADGDRMGKAIDRLKTIEEQQALSQKLQSFATMARDIVENHRGALIYSGGDDVLAFVPVHTVLDCATKLADEFAQLLTAFATATEPSPTLSMGIVLAHALTPLDQTLAAARAAEKQAKAIPRKDALCVVVEKRGGEPTKIAGSRRSTIDLLNTLIQLHEQGAIATKAQYELMELDRLANQSGDSEDVKRLIQTQAERVIARKRDGKGGELTAGTLDVIKRCLREAKSPAELGRALYVAQLIARSKNQLREQES